VVVGIPLGILVGLVSGVAFVFFLRSAFSEDPLKVAESLLAMPAAWFGGGWLTTVFDLERILDSYVMSLAVFFLVIVAKPAYLTIVRVGNEIGKV
jgi:fucose 4-O-acetylase-like acetyltransferase